MENRYQSANVRNLGICRGKKHTSLLIYTAIGTCHWFATDPQINKSIFGCRINSARQAVGNCFVHMRPHQSLPNHSEAETWKQSGRIVCFGCLFVFYFDPSIRVYAACVVFRVFLFWLCNCRRIGSGIRAASVLTRRPHKEQREQKRIRFNRRQSLSTSASSNKS